MSQPVKLEEEIRDHTYRVRSIREVQSLDFLQTLAITGKLADFAPGRRITLTDRGIAFLASAPIRQLALLLDAWWWHTNWLYIHYWEFFEDFEETALPYLTRTLLGKIAPEVWVPLKEFYEALIEMGGLDQLATVAHQDALKHGLEVMIIQALANFGMLEVKKKPKQIGTMTFDEPVAFRITPLGRQLLRTI